MAASTLSVPTLPRGVRLRSGFAVWGGLVALAAYGGTELGHRLWLAGVCFPTFRPASGLFLAALLLSPVRRWAWVVGAMAVGILGSQVVHWHLPAQQELAFFAVNALAMLLAAMVLRKPGEETYQIETLRAVWIFAGTTLLISGMITGAVSGALAVRFWQADFIEVWKHWLVSDLTGIWLIAWPVLSAGGRHLPLRWKPARMLEVGLLFGTLVAASQNLFTGGLSFLSLPSLLLMWVIWAMLRFGPRVGGVALLIIALTAMFSTVAGTGPFVRADRPIAETVFRLLTYLSLWAAFSQIVAAIIAERERAIAALAQLNRELEQRVTERTLSLTEAGAALLASEERFRLAAAATGFGAYDYHLRTGDLHWTPEMKAIYGLPVEAEINALMVSQQYLLPEEIERVRIAFEKSLEPGGTGNLEMEHRILPQGGGERWVRVSGRTLFEPTATGPVAVRAVGTCTDVTERKQAEVALRESENRLALAVKAGHSGTFDWEIARDVHLWSEDLLALYGLTRAEFHGRREDWLPCIHPADQAAIEEAVQSAFVTGQYSAQFRILRRDTGAVRWMEGRGMLMRGEDGSPLRLLGINVDITEQKQVEEALRESEQQLKFVLEEVQVGIWSVDLGTGLLTASSECRQNFGLSEEEEEFSSYQHVRALIHPDDRALEAEAAAESRRNGGEYDAEYRIVWPNGTVRWILARGQLSYHEAGREGRLAGIALDITERKEVEQALKESESKLRSYYETAPLCMGLVELEENDVLHLYDNPASCRFFGLPPGGTTGRRISEFGGSRGAIDLWLEYYRLSAAQETPVRLEVSFPAPQGERWLAIAVTPLAGVPAQRRRFSYVAEDVTERRRTETALRQHAARQAALLELTRTILTKRADADALGTVVFQRVCGVLDADLGFNYRLDVGTGRLRLVASFGLAPGWVQSAQDVALAQFLSDSGVPGHPPLPSSGPSALRPGDSFLRALGARAYACHPLLASDGRVLGVLAFASSRRERFEPEEIGFIQTLCHYVSIAWERSAAEAALLQAKEAAEGANRAKDDFLAALSHELRTPLNPVLLLASELQLQPELSGELRSDLATIRRNVELEARLIDDLLDLTRITRGKVSLELRATDLHGVLREALGILEADVAAKQLWLDLRLEAPVTLVLADAVRLQQVLWNVLRNAIKFTPTRGTVTVRSAVNSGKRVVLTVQDTGQGIAPEHLNTIFETFNQGDGGHRFGGLGLGLAIARSIVEMHGGSIRAESNGAGQGATFRIELPLLEQPALPVSARLGNGEVAPAPLDPVPRLRILLVEDHEPTRHALTRLLERRRHYVSAAANLASARRLAAGNEFDLLISDLGLPDGDGTELMQQFRETGGPPGMALSGYGMDEDLQRSSSAGFFAHLVKPVDVDVLDRTLAGWVQGRRASALVH